MIQGYDKFIDYCMCTNQTDGVSSGYCIPYGN